MDIKLRLGYYWRTCGGDVHEHACEEISYGTELSTVNC